MFKRYPALIFVILLFSIDQLDAGCGSCAADKNKTKSAFIESVPANGEINGKTFASCGMCNFDTKEKDCGLSVKIGSNVYSVANIGIDDHIDSHAKDGFCKVVRIVDVKGKIKKNKLYTSSFIVNWSY